MKFIIIGNPDSQRVQLFQSEASAQGIPCETYDYLDFLENNLFLEQILISDGILKIESPDEHPEARAYFVRKGEEVLKTNTVKQPIEFGRIQYNRLWYHGYCEFLDQLHRHIKRQNHQELFNSPRSIELMFHKLACQKFLQSNQFSIPENLGRINNLNHLLGLMDYQNCDKVVLKPFHNDVNSGVLILTRSKQETVEKRIEETLNYQLVCPIELLYDGERPKLYSANKIMFYHKESEIRDILNTLASDGIYAEKWIPKAVINEEVFDLKILVIKGQVEHILARKGEWPHTNLPLEDNQEYLRMLGKKMGKGNWKKMLSLVEKAVSSIRGASYASVDVIIEEQFEQAYIIEINPFGDFMPDLIEAGENTFESIINSVSTDRLLIPKRA